MICVGTPAPQFTPPPEVHRAAAAQEKTVEVIILGAVPSLGVRPDRLGAETWTTVAPAMARWLIDQGAAKPRNVPKPPRLEFYLVNHEDGSVGLLKVAAGTADAEKAAKLAGAVYAKGPCAGQPKARLLERRTYSALEGASPEVLAAALVLVASNWLALRSQLFAETTDIPYIVHTALERAALDIQVRDAEVRKATAVLAQLGVAPAPGSKP